jgi:protoheme IX farnesyltransferase
MIGWVAATGGISLEPCLLFLIVFFWTPPHFWALSLTRVDDYSRAGLPMLPVVAGTEATKRQILLYCIALAAVAAAPWLLGYAGAVYGTTTLIAGALMIMLATRLRSERDGQRGRQAAQRLFGFSILYLFIVFAALLIEAGFSYHGP